MSVTMWTHQQRNAIAFVPKITAPLSILGSSLIIYDIVKSKEKMGRTYSRLLLGMSIFDISSSFAIFCSTWAIPKGALDMPSVVGTTATCTAQGYFYFLGLGAAYYNCSLSFFYLFVIAYAWNDTTMKRVEWFLHGVPITMAIVLATVALPLELYNPAGFWCSMASMPYNCENGAHRYGVGECQRGEYAWMWSWFLGYGPVWFSILLVTGNMLTVVYLVWKKERASRKFKFRGSSHADTTSDDNQQDRSSFLMLWSRRRRQSKPKKKKRPGLANQVVSQAFYYVSAFYITYFPGSLHKLQSTLSDGSSSAVSFPVVFLVAFIVPLQGFFNYLIYIRPRLIKYLRENPEKNMLSRSRRAVKQALKKLCYCCADGAMDETVVLDQSNGFHDTAAEEEDPAYALQMQKKDMEESSARQGQSLTPQYDIEVPVTPNPETEEYIKSGAVKSVAFTDDNMSCSENGFSDE